MDPLLIDIPSELSSQRLSLRSPRAGDGPMVFKTARESLTELKQWMPWATDSYDLEGAEQWCRRAAAQFLSREQLAYLIFTKDGEHLGNLSAFKFDWTIPKCEIGYWLATARCGQGYMTEAVGAVVKMAFDLLKCERIEIHNDDRKKRSQRVAELCGFSLEGTFRHDSRDVKGELRDTRVYALLRKGGA